MSSRRILVVGAGIGGLTMARLLQRAGNEVTVVEGAHQLRTGGAAISLWFNGAKVLSELGLDTSRLGARIDRLVQRRSDGRVMFHCDVARLAEVFGVAAAVVARGPLIHELAGGLRAGTIIFGDPVTQVTRSVDAARVILGSGAILDTDLVIGADGSGSVVRRLFDHRVPTPTGWVAWQSLSRTPAADELGSSSLIVVGGGLYCGLMPAGENLVQLWFHLKDGQVNSRESVISDLVLRCKDWPHPVPALLDLIGPSDLERWPYLQGPIPTHYATERVATIGDAVHTMPPSLAQGASQAIEDAWILAQQLELHTELEPALQRYEALRRRKVRLLSWFAATDLAQRAEVPVLSRVRLPAAVSTAMLGATMRLVSNIL